MATTKLSKQWNEERLSIITKTASLNGEFMRETLDSSAVPAATARAMSVLICLRGAADNKPVTGAEIQAAIDAFMAGAHIETYIGPMGAELYRIKESS